MLLWLAVQSFLFVNEVVSDNNDLDVSKTATSCDFNNEACKETFVLCCCQILPVKVLCLIAVNRTEKRPA